MNSVIAYKKLSLGEGLADLFAYEIKNLEAFKASVRASVENLRSYLGCNDWSETCHRETYRQNDKNNWRDGCTGTRS